jgi:trk/ktr system potassium uptake protein
MSTPPPPGARRPGDRIIRVPRLTPERIPVQALRTPRPAPPPAVILVVSFALLILAGTLVLMLPLASTAGQATPFLDALFTATSAVCVTGLVVVDTGTYWSPFGHVVLLVLIQLGGLGIMTGATLLWLALGRRVSLHQRLVIRESLGTFSLAGVEQVVRRIVTMTIIIELGGTALLALRLARDYPLPTALWYGFFHAVSAFNSAGFDLFGEYRSLMLYPADVTILLTVAGLVILGGLGIVTLVDLGQARSFHRLSLDSKLVVSTSLLLLGVGTVSLFVLEYGNPATLGGLTPGQQLLSAFFHAVMPRSGGFSTVTIPALTEGALAIIIVLMFIGAAPASTGGGIKVTTFSTLLAAIVSTVRGRPQTEAFGREVPQTVIYRALTIALLAVALVMSAAIVLTITEGTSLTIALFEVVSAFATVGLSAGLSTALTPLGKLVLILLMFIGRLGPLTLALALIQAQRPTRYRYAVESVRTG